jgi:predicted MFS family arabinose efflux permease
VHNRGLALALALLGTGVTAIFLPSIATWLIGTVGWRWAFACIALLPLAIALPIAWQWFRDPPESAQYAEIRAVGQAGVEVREALRDYRFWIIAASILMVSIGVGGSITNFQPLLIDRGFDASFAAKIAGLIGLSVILGRLVAGYLIDRFWAPLVTLPMLALPALACFLLAQEQISVPGAMLSASLIGLAAGAETDLVAFLTARYFGLRNYGRLYGLQYAVFGFASGIAPAMFGRVHDLHGTYQPILYAAAVLFVLGAVLLLALGRYPTFDNVARASAT